VAIGSVPAETNLHDILSARRGESRDCNLRQSVIPAAQSFCTAAFFDRTEPASPRRVSSCEKGSAGRFLWSRFN